MIIEQHYDEEVLIGLLEETEQDAHVPACETCSGAIESYRNLTAALQDASVWDDRQLTEQPAPQTAALLRNFAATTAAEDAAAPAIVDKLLAASPEQRSALLARNPEWRTAGVVRRIFSAVDDTNFTDPKKAAELSALAIEVAESLDTSFYPFDTVTKLRARAWRERAFALHYIGAFPEALQALDQADKRAESCVVSDYESARVQQVRARVYRDLEKLDEALLLVRDSTPVFRAYGDKRRATIGDTIEATVLVRMLRFNEALAIELRTARDLTLDDESRTCALSNAAFCYRELSQFDQAKALYAQAVQGFDRLGQVSKRSSARWGLAKVLFDEGRHESAVQLLKQVRAEYVELGMGHDVALVSLDAADGLLAMQRPAEVADLCRGAIEYFRKAGLAFSEQAMTALAFLREAAEQGTLTPASVQAVRKFIEILPKQPNLQFAYTA